jgi:hypothetical protein
MRPREVLVLADEHYGAVEKSFAHRRRAPATDSRSSRSRRRKRETVRGHWVRPAKQIDGDVVRLGSTEEGW